MNQRRNAFTLIELLAVIIILAAIALIIAPLVLDVIKEQQRKTFKESINGILRSSRLELVNSGLKFPATFTYSNGKLVSPTGKKLKVTGKIPEGIGSVRYNSEDNIELAITDNTWCGTYNKTSKEVDVNEFTGECSAIMYTPEKCFQVEDNEKIEYTINEEACRTYVLEDYDTPEDIGEYCTGGFDSYGYTMDDDINSGYYSITELETEGVITVTSRKFDGIKITKYDKSDSDCPVDVVIPETINGKVVKAIGDAAFVENWDGNKNTPPTGEDAKKINSVVFSSGIETIGIGAFMGRDRKYNTIFNEITKLDFSKANNLKIIGHLSFDSNQLTSVTIPNSVTAIGSYAFIYNQLTNVDLSKATNLTIIGGDAFSYNYLTNVDLSNLANLTTIGGYAFDLNELTRVDLSGLTNLRVIGWDAFGYNHLTNIDLSDLVSLKKINDSAFYADSDITNRNIEFGEINQLTTIEVDAFCGRNSIELTYDKIPASVVTNEGMSCIRDEPEIES